MGARPLRCVIQAKIEDSLSDGMLAGKFNDGDAVRVEVQDKQIKLVAIPGGGVPLPPAQPVDPRALETPEEPPAPPPEAAPAPKPQRRPAPIPTTGPQPPAETPAAPAAQQPPPEERPRLQEILSAEEKRKLADEINSRKREVNEILQQVARRNLSAADRVIVERVRSFLVLSDQAAGRDDFRQADALSERAVVLARELRNAR
jgi:hypothetical protein